MDTDVVLIRRSRQRNLTRSSVRPLIGAAVAVLLGLQVLSQLLLPSIAANRLTTSLSPNGEGVHVDVSAFPALKLLFGDADTVKVRIARLVSSSHHVGNLLARTANVGTLAASVGELDTHGLVLTNVVLRKRGQSLTASGAVTRASVQAVLPLHLVVTPLPPGANGLLVNAKVEILGHRVSVTADVHAENGKIVLSPHAGGLATVLNQFHIDVFSNPAVWIDRVTAVARGNTYTLSASAHYR